MKDGHEGYRRRRSLPNHYNRVREMEQERGSGRDRYKEGDTDDRSGPRDYASSRGGRRGGDSRRYGAGNAAYERYNRYAQQDEGRLGGDYGNDGEASEPTIKFKGRGSMKYRERQQQSQGQGQGQYYSRR